MILPDLLHFRASIDAANSGSDAVAIVDDMGSFSHASLMAAVGVVLETILKDVPVQTRVACLMPRSFLHVVVQHATWAAQCIHVPLSPFHTAPEMLHAITDSGCELIIHHPSLKDKVSGLALDGSTKLVSLDYADLAVPSSQPLAITTFPVPDKLSLGAMILFTSGTTGKPKGVLTTISNIEAQISALLTAWEWKSTDNIHLLLPLHHIHGIINILNCALAAGASLETSAAGFSAPAVWERWIDPTKPRFTLFMAVPTVYAKMISTHDTTLTVPQRELCASVSRGFRLMVSGSAALPTPIASRWEAITGHVLLERYGMTEIGMALGNPLHGPRLAGTVGVPFSGVEAMIDDATGELMIRGPQVFKCYYNRPDATSEAFTADGGWFKTGDVAKVVDGIYTILGRASVDILKSGGHKISALHVERELLAHDAVAEAVVVGIPDVTYGEVIGSVVVLKEGDVGAGVDGKALGGFLRSRVAAWEIPRVWKFVERIPRNAVGKVNKKVVIAELFPDEVAAYNNAK